METFPISSIVLMGIVFFFIYISKEAEEDNRESNT